MEYATTTCTTIDASTTQCLGQAVPTYHDWVFVSEVQIFLLAFIALGFIFSPFKPRR